MKNDVMESVCPHLAVNRSKLTLLSLFEVDVIGDFYDSSSVWEGIQVSLLHFLFYEFDTHLLFSQ